MDGLHHLQLAAGLLDRPGGYLPPRSEFAEAFGLVWGGLAAAESWPEVLRAQAAGLIVAMRRHGDVYQTAYAMTDAEAHDFAAMLRTFVDHAERLEIIQAVAKLNARGVVSIRAETRSV